MVHDPLRPQPDEPGQVPAGDGDRVAKVLARAGVGSRRDVERLIAEGRVAINGRSLDTPGVRLEPGDIVTVDGEVVSEPEPARLFRYHKPVGLVTTHKDPAGRPTVFDALPAELPRLISVGRLDLNSEGLLLLTNDGQLARALEAPSGAMIRRYRVRAHGRTNQERLDRLLTGITVEGVKYGAIEAKLDKAREGATGANLWITVALAEGKNREVRRVLDALGLKVNRLIRLAYGPLALGPLGVGEIEEVGPRVVRELFGHLIEPENLPSGDRPQYRVKPKLSRRGEPTPEIAPLAAPEPPEKKTYKAGWARPKVKARPHPPPKAKPQTKAKSKPKPSGSRPGPGPGAGPPRPKGSASRPGKTPARRTGPPRSGGKAPRA